MERPYIVWDRGQLLERHLQLLGRLRDADDSASLLLDCEIPSDTAFGRASDLVSQQKGKMKLKKMLRLFRDEVRWETGSG